MNTKLMQLQKFVKSTDCRLLTCRYFQYDNTSTIDEYLMSFIKLMKQSIEINDASISIDSHDNNMIRVKYHDDHDTFYVNINNENNNTRDDEIYSLIDTFVNSYEHKMLWDKFYVTHEFTYEQYLNAVMNALPVNDRDDCELYIDNDCDDDLIIVCSINDDYELFSQYNRQGMITTFDD